MDERERKGERAETARAREERGRAREEMARSSRWTIVWTCAPTVGRGGGGEGGATWAFWSGLKRQHTTDLARAVREKNRSRIAIFAGVSGWGGAGLILSTEMLLEK